MILVAAAPRSQAPPAHGVAAAQRELQIVRQAHAKCSGLKRRQREQSQALTVGQRLEPPAVQDDRPGTASPSSRSTSISAQVPPRGFVEESSESNVTKPPSVGMTSRPSGESDSPDVPVSKVWILASAPDLRPCRQLRETRIVAGRGVLVEVVERVVPVESLNPTCHAQVPGVIVVASAVAETLVSPPSGHGEAHLTAMPEQVDASHGRTGAEAVLIGDAHDRRGQQPQRLRDRDLQDDRFMLERRIDDTELNRRNSSSRRRSTSRVARWNGWPTRVSRCRSTASGVRSAGQPHGSLGPAALPADRRPERPPRAEPAPTRSPAPLPRGRRATRGALLPPSLDSRGSVRRIEVDDRTHQMSFAREECKTQTHDGRQGVLTNGVSTRRTVPPMESALTARRERPRLWLGEDGSVRPKPPVRPHFSADLEVARLLRAKSQASKRSGYPCDRTDRCRGIGAGRSVTSAPATGTAVACLQTGRGQHGCARSKSQGVLDLNDPSASVRRQSPLQEVHRETVTHHAHHFAPHAPGDRRGAGRQGRFRQGVQLLHRQDLRDQDRPDVGQ